MKKHYESLDFYIRKLYNKEYFSLARYGDGEWLCIFGKPGGNSNGCDYTFELRQDLIKSLQHEEPNFYYGMQRILFEQEKQAEYYLEPLPKHEWYDTEVFADTLAKGELYPLIEQLRRMHVVVIGNEEWKWDKRKLFTPEMTIKIPRANTHAIKDNIKKTILKYNQPAVYLFSAGMAANVLVSELHGKIPNSFFIDIGHIWDIFCGLKSRDYLAKLSPEIINKNLNAETEHKKY